MYKDARLEFRLTEEEKQFLKAYASKHNKTVSEVIRELCNSIFKGEKEQWT